MRTCECGVNAPSLLEVDGESVMVFGLSEVILRLEEEDLSPNDPDFNQAVLDALRETKNRIPKDQQAGCIAAIAEIYKEYLSAKRESSRPKEKHS